MDTNAIITDAAGAELVITGALTLILKLKAIITSSQQTDVKIAIQTMDQDAQTANAATIAEAEAWAKANGLTL